MRRKTDCLPAAAVSLCLHEGGENMGMICTVALLTLLALSGYMRLFRVSEEDAEKMKLGDYAEYLRATGIQDTESVRTEFFGLYDR